MEACKGPFMPINKEIRRMIADGVFGDVLYVHAAYSYDGHFPADSYLTSTLKLVFAHAPMRFPCRPALLIHRNLKLRANLISASLTL